MIEGAAWRRWVYFRLPLGFLVLWLLFPFYWMLITAVRPDGELYRPWNATNYTPFWTTNPTWAHVEYLFEETIPVTDAFTVAYGGVTSDDWSNKRTMLDREKARVAARARVERPDTLPPAEPR